jgi:hypothetical protein
MIKLYTRQLGLSSQETRRWPDMKLRSLDDILKFPKYPRGVQAST